MKKPKLCDQIKSIEQSVKSKCLEKKSIKSNEIQRDNGLQVYDPNKNSQRISGNSRRRYSHPAAHTLAVPLKSISFSLCHQNQHEIEARHSGVRLSFSTQTSSCLVESCSKTKVVKMSHFLSEISPLCMTLAETDTAYCMWLHSSEGVSMLNEISHRTKTLIELKFPQFWITSVATVCSLEVANSFADSCTTLTFIGLTCEALNNAILQYKSFKAYKFKRMKWYCSKLQNTDNLMTNDLKGLIEDAMNLQVFMAFDPKSGLLEVKGIAESVGVIKAKVEAILYRPSIENPILTSNIIDKIKLSTSDASYRRVVGEFLKGISDCVDSIQVFQIRNPFLEAMFNAYSAKVISEADGVKDPIKFLFHGTGYESAQKIFKSEFNRSFCGKNGTTHGKGVYFSPNSSTSLAFCEPNIDGVLSMIYAKVATGRYIQGAHFHERKNLPAYIHSTVDNLYQPNEIVVYHDAAAFPCYEIQFCRSDVF